MKTGTMVTSVEYFLYVKHYWRYLGIIIVFIPHNTSQVGYLGAEFKYFLKHRHIMLYNQSLHQVDYPGCYILIF